MAQSQLLSVEEGEFEDELHKDSQATERPYQGQLRVRLPPHLPAPLLYVTNSPIPV